MRRFYFGAWLKLICLIVTVIIVVTTGATILAAFPALLLDQPIIIDSENFLVMMEALWEETDKYLGQNVEMVGFVYADPLLAPTDFVLARSIRIGEQAADVQVAGLLCRYSEQALPAPDQWVRVRGKLAKTSYYHIALEKVVSMPYLQVTEIAPTAKPTEEFIYP